MGRHLPATHYPQLATLQYDYAQCQCINISVRLGARWCLVHENHLLAIRKSFKFKCDTLPSYFRMAASAYNRYSELQVAGARAANSSAVLNSGVISASWPSIGVEVEKGSRGSRPKSIVSGLARGSRGISVSSVVLTEAIEYAPLTLGPVDTCKTTSLPSNAKA
eukprot:scaffold7105_cov116-Isochrysis_galbana.AAC.5